ncbi:MAG: hypothetical protein KGZ80_09885 [Methylomonas sp.]|nr:hypothetical protein [Methylomonas sp.]PPD20179.1 MAG: hypothetical protein CTY23_09665 [Methylomonas sp.]PPD25362.1 MAG: hypothetical protein CTY22_09035 [Methylomonas sp.]PPD35379.1 MAG: hypothetical protein CTY21_09035 [Methylomonas sp.]PPD38348.1 MAG: hypothetical protein CTY17_09570 [Methylomonas sp.]
MKNSFFLVIPEQHKNAQQLLSFSESALRQWLSQLPTANPALATRLFQDLLLAMIAVEMPPVDRLNALELLRPQFLNIEDYLRSRLMQTGFPKSENDKKIFFVLVALEKQLAIGYWSVVRDMTRREVGWLQARSLAQAMQRTVKGLSSIVISHYMMGYPVPDWIWFDLHALYKLAQKQGKHDAKVAEPAGMTNKTSTVEDSYKQILLLSLSYPLGLMQKEFLLVYGFIEKIGDVVQLAKQAPNADGASLQCVILLDEDLPPMFTAAASLKQDQRSEAERLYLDVSRLPKIVKHSDKYCGKDDVRFSSLDLHPDADPKLSSELFDYLMQRWRGLEPQGTALFADRLDRYLAIGLDATHELQDNRQCLASSLELRVESYSERALSCSFDHEGVLSIGSLVSFRRTDALPHQRTLAVVCKIQIPKQDKKLIFELFVVATQPYPVKYQDIHATDPDESQKALLYASKVDGEERSYIVLASFMIKDGDILRLYMAQEVFPIILNGRKNIGLGYWQFECRRILETLPDLPAPNKSQAQARGFDFT